MKTFYDFENLFKVNLQFRMCKIVNDGEIIVDAKRVFVHPAYGIQTFLDYDVAVIELAKQVHLSREVGVFWLPMR